MANFCPKCGKKTAPTDVYCASCGTSLPDDDCKNGASASAPQSTTYGAANSANPYGASAPQPTPTAYSDAADSANNANAVNNANVADNASVDAEPTVGPSFWNAFLYCVGNYFNFKGRATRTEYWGYLLVSIPLGFILSVLSACAFNDIELGKLGGFGFFFFPTLALEFRRLHDTNNSGWAPIILLLIFVRYLLLFFELLAILLVLTFVLWLAFCPGTKGPNKYGPRRLNPSDVKR